MRTRIRLVFLILTFALIGFSQTAVQKNLPSAGLPKDAISEVTELYKQVVLRKPLGLPRNSDRQAIFPFLSVGLIQRLEEAQACEDDYHRRNDDGDRREQLKPAYAWLESGLFSGDNEEAIPSASAVLRSDKQGDGSFRVLVRLTYKETFKTYGRPPDPKNQFNWKVVALVVREGRRFAIDDVLYLNANDSTKVESRLSEVLNSGCENGKWVGFETR